MLTKGFTIVLGIAFCAAFPLTGQESIRLQNPSFEDMPRKGVPGMPSIKGWHDCGLSKFPTESPPDIHPVMNNAWDVALQSYDGNTYLGMVTRANDTYESLSQALSSPIQAGVCYSFTAFLAQSNQYKRIGKFCSSCCFYDVGRKLFLRKSRASRRVSSGDEFRMDAI